MNKFINMTVHPEIIHLPTIKNFYVQIPQNITLQEVSAFLITLDSIVILFKDYFKLDEDNMYSIIILSYDIDAPKCFRKSNIILLSTKFNALNQAAYQFSHELCHILIPGDVHKSIRWFEESLCETASYFFLKQLYSYMIDNKISIVDPNGNPYAPYFCSYIKNEMSKAEKFNLNNMNTIEYLAQNCYDRNKNKYVALHLLPIFEKYPQLWKAIPYLSNINYNPSFKFMLQQWMDMIPDDCKNGIGDIIRIFQ